MRQDVISHGVEIGSNGLFQIAIRDRDQVPPGCTYNQSGKSTGNLLCSTGLTLAREVKVAGVRWGILGTGAMAELFAQALSSVDGAVLYGVASRTRGRSESFARRFGARYAYRTYDELLEQPDIDIVYVATRNEYHHEDSIAAVNAGKAVLCEKPFALSADQGRSIVEAARRNHVFCMEAMWMRCSPAMREIFEIAHSGGIGEVRLVTAQFGFPLAFDPLDRVYVQPGGGALYDFGVYPLAFVQALCGRPCRIRSAAVIGSGGVDEQVTALLEYESGCQAFIAASIRAQLANVASVHATDGIVEFIRPIPFPDTYHLQKTAAHIRGKSNSDHGLSNLHIRAWSRLTRIVLHRELSGAMTRRPVANGYACEAAVAQRCIQAGLLESPEVPLDETISVLESMDTMRNQWSTGK